MDFEYSNLKRRKRVDPDGHRFNVALLEQRLGCSQSWFFYSHAHLFNALSCFSSLKHFSLSSHSALAINMNITIDIPMLYSWSNGRTSNLAI